MRERNAGGKAVAQVVALWFAWPSMRVGLFAAVVLALGACFVGLGETNANRDAGGGGPADPDATVAVADDASVACPPSNDPSLLGWWRFEEPDGVATITDCSGHGLDGKLVDAKSLVRRVAVPGRLGRGIDIDGISGCFDLGPAPDLAFTSGPYTMAAWISVRTFGFGSGSPRWVLGRAEFDGDAGHYRGWGAGSHPETSFEMKVFPTGSVFGSFEAAIPRDALVHVAAVREGAKARIYVDGVKKTESDIVSPPATLAGAHALLGCRDPVEPPFDGLVDDVRIYGRALGDPEIAALAHR